MGTREAVQALIDALESHNLEIVPGLVTDDFVFDNGRGTQVGVQPWLGILRGMVQAMPDLAFNLEIIEATDDRARMRSHFSGTHTGTLDLTAMGMGFYPATNQYLEANPEESEAVIRENKVAALTIFRVEGGGMAALMAQMGVEFPPQ